MKPIKLGPKGQFSLGGELFVVDISEGRHRRPSDSEAFTLVKNEPYLTAPAVVTEAVTNGPGALSLINSSAVRKMGIDLKVAWRCEPLFRRFDVVIWSE